jgi:hypothetical protein
LLATRIPFLKPKAADTSLLGARHRRLIVSTRVFALFVVVVVVVVVGGACNRLQVLEVNKEAATIRVEAGVGVACHYTVLHMVTHATTLCSIWCPIPLYRVESGVPCHYRVASGVSCVVLRVPFVPRSLIVSVALNYGRFHMQT